MLRHGRLADDHDHHRRPDHDDHDGAGCEGPGQGTCCAGVACQGGQCCIPHRLTSGVPDPAPACVATSECCQNNPGTIACQPGGRCCAPLAAGCNGDVECCSGACDPDAQACATCLGEGVSRTFSPGACCAGLACEGDPGSRRCQQA